MTPLVFLDQNLAQRCEAAFLHYLSCLYCLFPNCWFSDRNRMEFVMTLAPFWFRIWTTSLFIGHPFLPASIEVTCIKLVMLQTSVSI